MRQLIATQTLKIPKNVTVAVKSRVVKVEGPRGALTKSFKHLNLDIYLTGPSGKKAKKTGLRVDLWLGSKVEAAAIRTVCSHVKNMITGVTRGFEYRMRFVYAHFPINANIVNGGKDLEVRNYLGEKMVRHVPMLEGVTVGRSERQKDEIFVTGNNLESVSQSAASIQASTAIFNKDIRKFLDGIYVSEKVVLEEKAPAAAKGKGK